MKQRCRCLVFFLTLAIYCQGFATTQTTDFITMTLPESLLATTLNDILPLQLDTSSSTVQGTFTIMSIDNLKLLEQQLSFRLKLKADDLEVVTEISGHSLRMKVGTVDLNFRCNAILRFDKKTQILYVRPLVVDEKNPEEQGSNTTGKAILTLLNGHEFPITMQKLEPLVARASNKTVTIDMKIMDIHATKSSLLISLKPEVISK